eukprot:6262093-Amphidinium_carterae.1
MEWGWQGWAIDGMSLMCLHACHGRSSSDSNYSSSSSDSATRRMAIEKRRAMLAMKGMTTVCCGCAVALVAT